ncbi:MAG: PEGA domain-containing protein [Sandaracinaceae bacterium]|nr:PEGA domain-containing protein [Sandaracinaceae bacterium]
MIKRALLPLLVALASLAPSVAGAQSVMVLGIRSVEGDDDFTRNLTGAIRNAASQVEGWQVSDREVTFVQMALVHDCDNPNPTCLGSIAESLGAERVIYGEVRRTSARSDFDFSINLHLFNAAQGGIEHSVSDTIPSVHQDIDDLRVPARRWIRSLQGAPRAGTLIVRVNVPGAEVSIDGRQVGVVDANGALRIDDVEAGHRQVRVTATDHAAFASSVSVPAYGEATLEGELQLGSDGGGGGGVSPELVAGSALLVAAAGFAVVWAYSGVTVLGHTNSTEWAAIRAEYMESTQNLCSTGVTNRAAEICSEAATLEVMQFVFMGLTVLAGGLGLYFVVAGATASDDGEERASADAVTFELVPSVGLDHAYVGGRLRF